MSCDDKKIFHLLFNTTRSLFPLSAHQSALVPGDGFRLCGIKLALTATRWLGCVDEKLLCPLAHVPTKKANKKTTTTKTLMAKIALYLRR